MTTQIDFVTPEHRDEAVAPRGPGRRRSPPRRPAEPAPRREQLDLFGAVEPESTPRPEPAPRER